MMTPEEMEAELKHTATKEDMALLRADLHKELHAQSWRFFLLMLAQTGLILGAVYFMLGDVKSDLREIRNRLSAERKAAEAGK
jgi:hypothetical protein